VVRFSIARPDDWPIVSAPQPKRAAETGTRFKPQTQSDLLAADWLVFVSLFCQRFNTNPSHPAVGVTI
jgi:hypothetical protein